ncbi:MAG: hypothetical protein HY292_02060 [Planctomycetes bacterium]|nr:hypothetical protein [Planctomycetota bacterium]
MKSRGEFAHALVTQREKVGAQPYGLQSSNRRTPLDDRLIRRRTEACSLLIQAFSHTLPFAGKPLITMYLSSQGHCHTERRVSFTTITHIHWMPIGNSFLFDFRVEDGSNPHLRVTVTMAHELRNTMEWFPVTSDELAVQCFAIAVQKLIENGVDGRATRIFTIDEWTDNGRFADGPREFFPQTPALPPIGYATRVPRRVIESPSS